MEGNPIQLLNEGSLLTSNLTSLNFVGEGITAAASGGTGTITVPAIPPALAVSDEGTILTPSASSLNFVGGAVSTTVAGSAVTVTINDTTTFGSAPPPIASSSTAGTASSVSRSDHTHEGVLSVNGAKGAVTLTIPVPSSVTPAPIAATGNAGSSADFSRRDHTHEGVLSVNGNKGAVTIAVPVPSNAVPSPLGAAASGSGADFSRSDHVHAHGNQAGGTLHSLATSGAHGFMSLSDKAKVDAYMPGKLTLSTSSPASPAVNDLWIDTSGPGTGTLPHYAKLSSTFSTTSTTAVNVGLSFTPEANKTYAVEGQFLMRTSATGNGSRSGVAWPTGLTDGVVSILQNFSANQVDLAYGNINAAVANFNGGLPTTTQSYVSDLKATVVAGASPSGNFEITLQSEGGSSVSMQAGSWLRWQEI